MSLGVTRLNFFTMVDSFVESNAQTTVHRSSNSVTTRRIIWEALNVEKGQIQLVVLLVSELHVKLFKCAMKCSIQIIDFAGFLVIRMFKMGREYNRELKRIHAVLSH